MEIMLAGGGINSTVRQTRAASLDDLVAQTWPRLERMLAYGTTTVEAKTGYGLDTATEIKMLEAILALDAELPIDIVPTFMGAHAIPPEYEDRTDAFVDLLVGRVLRRGGLRRGPIAAHSGGGPRGGHGAEDSRRRVCGAGGHGAGG
jgi:imidazolonepropionase